MFTAPANIVFLPFSLYTMAFVITLLKTRPELQDAQLRKMTFMAQR